MTALTLTLGCAGARASAPGASPPPAARPQLTLTTELPLSDAERRAIIERVQAAFAFALTLSGWSRPDALAAEPVEIRVDTTRPGVEASTSGAHRFTIGVGALSQPNADGIFAHELTHLQDFRAARQGMRQPPRYLEEGRGYFVGREWRRLRGEPGGDGERAALLATATAEEVAFVLAKFRHQPELREVGRAGKGPLARGIGVFFVDYLRTRAGYPDAMARLSRAWERLGQGGAFEPAFSAQFDGLTLGAAEASFVAFIRETEGNPAERLKGTPFEGATGLRPEDPEGAAGFE
ncbi:MAG: hypothetical protein IPJ65_04775 [Archangiaceae bacterium]|nr:hypothetical protein [Archangiaceae bacterium]